MRKFSTEEVVLIDIVEKGMEGAGLNDEEKAPAKAGSSRVAGSPLAIGAAAAAGSKPSPLRLKSRLPTGW